MAYILKDKLKLNDVIAIGTDTTTKETWDIMGNWADKIYFVAEERIKKRIPKKFNNKVVHFDIGKDIWCNPNNKELRNILMDRLKEENELIK